MKKELLAAAVWAGIILSVALAAKYARAHGYIDADTLLRVVAMNGLMIIFYGNRIPKTFAPNATARQVQRFTAWTMVLSGLVYTGFWALAPIPMAETFGTGAVAAGVCLTIGYCLAQRGNRQAGA